MPEKDNLLALPSVLVADVLSAWIEVEDFMKLDSACCNRTLRKIYLDVVCQPECSVNTWLIDDDEFSVCEDAIAWAHLRNIQLQNITLARFSQLDVHNGYLKHFGKGVTAARGRYGSAHAWTCFQYCPNIVSVDLDEYDVDSSLRLLFEYLPKLREFRCNFRKTKHSITASDLEGLSCPSIKLIKLERFVDASVPMAILKLAVSAETVILRDLGHEVDSVVDGLSASVTILALQAFYLSPAAFCRLPTLCPHLVHLQVASLAEGLTVDMMDVLAGFKHLESLDLTGSFGIDDDVLCALGDACGSQLSELFLAHCNCNPVTLAAVLRQFTNVKAFGVSDNYAKLDLSPLHNASTLMIVHDGPLDVEYLNRIVEHCGNVQHLSLHFYHDIHRGFPTYAIDEFIKRLPSLQTFNLLNRGGREAEGEAVKRWQAARPDVVFESKRDKQEWTALQNYMTKYSSCLC